MEWRAAFWILILFGGCHLGTGLKPVFQTELLQIEALTPQVFIHTSYLEVPGAGKYPCNGLIYIDSKEVVVMDTPTSDAASRELLHWIKHVLKGKVKAVVVNHFHDDCLGGLGEFHRQNIASYANKMTLVLAAEREEEVPRFGFDGEGELMIGHQRVINRFIGEGHTRDNIITYLPEESLIFGGCLIKEVHASKGNLADANLTAWANTVRKVKDQYPDVKLVVPGHGKPGGIELLNYTIQLFENSKF